MEKCSMIEEIHDFDLFNLQESLDKEESKLDNNDEDDGEREQEAKSDTIVSERHHSSSVFQII